MIANCATVAQHVVNCSAFSTKNKSAHSNGWQSLAKSCGRKLLHSFWLSLYRHDRRHSAVCELLEMVLFKSFPKVPLVLEFVKWLAL